MYGFFKSSKYPVNIRRQISPFYCGVCKSIEEFSGFRGRMFASYDAAMPLYLKYLSGPDQYSRKPESCCFRVINPVNIIGPENDDSRVLAAITLVYLHLDLLDKKQDKESSMFHRIVEKIMRRAMENAMNYLKEKNIDIGYFEDLLKLQKKIESKQDEGIEFCKASDATEKAFETVYRLMHGDEFWALAGRFHGRLVYFWDALKDIRKDRLRPSFNPLFNLEIHEISELFHDSHDRYADSLEKIIDRKKKSELFELIEFNRTEKVKEMEACLNKMGKYLK